MEDTMTLEENVKEIVERVESNASAVHNGNFCSWATDALLVLFRQKALEYVPEKYNLLETDDQWLINWRKGYNKCISDILKSIGKAFGEGKK